MPVRDPSGRYRAGNAGNFVATLCGRRCRKKSASGVVATLCSNMEIINAAGVQKSLSDSIAKHEKQHERGNQS